MTEIFLRHIPEANGETKRDLKNEELVVRPDVLP